MGVDVYVLVLLVVYSVFVFIRDVLLPEQPSLRANQSVRFDFVFFLLCAFLVCWWTLKTGIPFYDCQWVDYTYDIQQIFLIGYRYNIPDILAKLYILDLCFMFCVVTRGLLGSNRVVYC